MTKYKRSLLIGADIGGTHVSVGLVDLRGRALKIRRTQISPGEPAVDVIDRMAHLALRLTEEASGRGYRVLAAGVGSPGPLDRRRGVIIDTPNLKWKDVRLVAMLRERIRMPVTLDNDAVSATYGEWWAGAAKGANNVVCLTLGTGVGGGFIADNKLYHGCSDLAGHFGHMIIERGGRLCSCGNRGCLEAYASATAIVKRAVDRADELERSIVWKAIDGDTSNLTSKIIFECAIKGDGFAREIFRETAEYLAVGLANIIHGVNPDVIVIGGAVSKAGKILFDPLRRYVAQMVFKSVLPYVRIVKSRLGDKAGVVGSAGIAKAELGL